MNFDPRTLIKPVDVNEGETMKLVQPSPTEYAQLENIFSHHPPTGTKGLRHDTVRRHALNFAFAIVATCPPSAERSEAVVKIREAMFYANSAIACHPEPTVTNPTTASPEKPAP